MNRLLEEDREARSPTRKQPPPLNIKRSFSQGATSPTKKAETQPNTPTFRPRRVSGAKMADRMAWIRELEEKSSGKGGLERAAMYKNLQGGVADKLARFESSNKDSGSALTRANSHSSRKSTFNDAYGIENAIGKRLSRATTIDDEFRRKMEEVAQNTKKKIDKEGDQEALIAQVNRDAELALKEEKRRSLKMDSAGPFKYAFNDKAGRKTDLVPDPAKTTAATTPPADEVDLQSFTPTRKGSTKMPKFNVKDPNAVAASANPSAALVEEKIAAPKFKLKNPKAVAASANPPVSMEPQVDDGEYDPFNVMTYPVSKAMPAIRKLTAAETKEQRLSMEASEPQPADESIKEAFVIEPAAADATQVLDETEREVAEKPTMHIPALEPVEIAHPQPTEESKIETATQEESRIDEDMTAPVTEPTGITTSEVKEEQKAEVPTEPVAAVKEKEALELVEQTTTDANEETKADETSQPTPKIEAKTPAVPIEPIALEPPRVEDDTKSETIADSATTASPPADKLTAVQGDIKGEESVEPATAQSSSPEQSTAVQKDIKLETTTKSVTATNRESPAAEEATANIPVINTTPPTPPAKKETSIPKYVALRERAQKAAEMPSKPTPAPVAPSQTFSRLFGPPMTSGMGRSRSPSPARTVKKDDVPAEKADAKEEKLAKDEPTQVMPSTEKSGGKEVSIQPAKEEVSVPKETPIAAVNDSSLNGKAPEPNSELTTLKNTTPIDQGKSAEIEALIKEPTPLEKAEPAEVADGGKVWPVDEVAPVPVGTAAIETATSMPMSKEIPVQEEISPRKVLPCSDSRPVKEDGPIQQESSVTEEAGTPNIESPTPSLPEDTRADSASVSTSEKISPSAALTGEVDSATLKMGTSSVGITSSDDENPATPICPVANLSTVEDKA